jgi:hypothetical protein
MYATGSCIAGAFGVMIADQSSLAVVDAHLGLI